MTGDDRSSLRRAIITVLALVGLLAMHGLSANNGQAMPGMTQAQASVIPAEDADGAGQSATTAMAMSRSKESPATQSHAAPALVGWGDFGPSVAGAAAMAMGPTCLALLTTLILLLVGRLVTTLRRMPRPEFAAALRSWLASALDPDRPPLAALSVLRT